MSSPQATSINSEPKPKRQRQYQLLSPRKSVKLYTISDVRVEMSRLYRLALRRRIKSEEMTRFIYALKEIRCAMETEVLIEVQRRLAMLTVGMESANGNHILDQPAIADGRAARAAAPERDEPEGDHGPAAPG